MAGEFLINMINPRGHRGGFPDVSGRHQSIKDPLMKILAASALALLVVGHTSIGRLSRSNRSEAKVSAGRPALGQLALVNSGCRVGAVV